MIAYLIGYIVNKGKNFLIINVNGVGYKVFVSNNLLSDTSIAQEIELYIYQQVGEQVLALFGLRSLAELEFYELLLSVSGVGPKTALAFFSVADVDGLKDSIMRGDADFISKVPGIGKKTAERIVLELGTKIAGLLKDGVQPSRLVNPANDEIDALVALGYSWQQAREALQHIGDDAKDSGERVRLALRMLGR